MSHIYELSLHLSHPLIQTGPHSISPLKYYLQLIYVNGYWKLNVSIAIVKCALFIWWQCYLQHDNSSHFLNFIWLKNAEIYDVLYLICYPIQKKRYSCNQMYLFFFRWGRFDWFDYLLEDKHLRANWVFFSFKINNEKSNTAEPLNLIDTDVSTHFDTQKKIIDNIFITETTNNSNNKTN